MDKPRFAHDCDGCLYLGQYEQFDLYLCPRCDEGSVIARYGDWCGDYSSCPVDCISQMDACAELWATYFAAVTSGHLRAGTAETQVYRYADERRRAAEILAEWMRATT